MTNGEKLTFWGSWYAAAATMGKLSGEENRVKFLVGILDYRFAGRIPEEGTVERMAYELVKSTIEISGKRQANAMQRWQKQNWMQNGMQSEMQNGMQSEMQNGMQSEMQNGMQSEMQNGMQSEMQNGMHVKVKVKEQTATARTRARTRNRRPTRKQFIAAGEKAGVPAEFAGPFYDELVTSGWADKDGREIGNWQRYLKTSYNDEKNSAARENAFNPIAAAGEIGCF